uniref:Uncharacterized protein n=1 Tax=mine drainage metagenome TaxID=410659 RepID=E6Q7C6_9ZZZZ
MSASIVRSALLGLVLVAAVALLHGALIRPAAAAAGPSCGVRVVHLPGDVVFRILFAKNGAVQQYVLVSSDKNPELVNDRKKFIERQFGPEAVNAPPLRIVAFKAAPGGGGLLIPDKAVDSCGRTLTFQ